MSKKNFMEETQRVSADEFKRIRQKYIDDLMCREIFFPAEDEFEQVLVQIFSRANRWLHQPIKVFKQKHNPSKQIREYRFDHAKLVFFGHDRPYMSFVHDRRVSQNFRKFIVQNMLALDDAVEKKLRPKMSFRELMELSMLYKNFHDSDEYSLFHYHHEKYADAE